MKKVKKSSTKERAKTAFDFYKAEQKEANEKITVKEIRAKWDKLYVEQKQVMFDLSDV